MIKMIEKNQRKLGLYDQTAKLLTLLEFEEFEFNLKTSDEDMIKKIPFCYMNDCKIDYRKYRDEERNFDAKICFEHLKGAATYFYEISNFAFLFKDRIKKLKISGKNPYVFNAEIKPFERFFEYNNVKHGKTTEEINDKLKMFAKKYDQKNEWHLVGYEAGNYTIYKIFEITRKGGKPLPEKISCW